MTNKQENMTPLSITSEEGVELTVNVPTDVFEILQNPLKPGTDYHTLMTGFSEEMLQKAFSSVEDKKNWKNPICALCPEKDQLLISKAIWFFTSSVATFEFARTATVPNPDKNIEAGDRLLIVRADGYYAAVGS